MPVPTTIESLSTTAASNGPAGSEQRTLADDGLRQAYAFIKQLVTLGSNIASASTITPPSTGSVFNITGTTGITAIASTYSWDGRVVTLIFADAVALTHSSGLSLPGAVSLTTAANTVAQFVQTATSTWRCLFYLRTDAKVHDSVGTAYSAGFLEVPQNSRSAAYTTVLADAGKQIYHPSTDANARTFTIDSNANVAYPIGTTLTFINETSNVVTIAITSDTLVLAGTGTTGSRSLAQYGMKTAVKVTSTRWFINGVGLS
jgi:hypothetical protein